ncbi:MAG TPA: hypothetical protein VFY68_14360, partial [Nitrososphaeraceae archaeon]|nr:hypothetical protein [Nitrososphaeraceae archaeon]
NLAFANQTAKALAPTIELIVIASIIMLWIKAFEFINAYFVIIQKNGNFMIPNFYKELHIIKNFLQKRLIES